MWCISRSLCVAAPLDAIGQEHDRIEPTRGAWHVHCRRIALPVAHLWCDDGVQHSGCQHKAAATSSCHASAGMAAATCSLSRMTSAVQLPNNPCQALIWLQRTAERPLATVLTRIPSQHGSPGGRGVVLVLGRDVEHNMPGLQAADACRT
eukprot:351625-Chlamydomonas_euryale.AAC.5